MNLSSKLSNPLVIETMKARFITDSNGGTTVANTWTTWPLNTFWIDITGSSASAPQFTLPAGRYDVFFSAAPREFGDARLALYDVSNTSYILKSAAFDSGTTSSSYGIRNICLYGSIDTESSAVYEIRYLFKVAQATNGLGTDIGTGNRYGSLTITRWI